jgi:hypothetical protein
MEGVRSAKIRLDLASRATISMMKWPAGTRRPFQPRVGFRRFTRPTRSLCRL